MSTLLLVEQTAPDTPSSGQVIMYPKTDGKMYTKDDAGTESTVSTDPATQAQQEAGSATNVYVSPGRQHFHPGMIKGWGQADPSGAVSASYNLTSVTDSGTGDCTFTWATDLSSGNYWAHGEGIIGFGASAATTHASSVIPTSLAAGVTRVQVARVSDGTLTDPSYYTCAIAGDMA
jgi:hypothetical protein